MKSKHKDYKIIKNKTKKIKNKIQDKYILFFDDRLENEPKDKTSIIKFIKINEGNKGKGISKMYKKIYPEYNRLSKNFYYRDSGVNIEMIKKLINNINKKNNIGALVFDWDKTLQLSEGGLYSGYETKKKYTLQTMLNSLISKNVLPKHTKINSLLELMLHDSNQSKPFERIKEFKKLFKLCSIKKIPIFILTANVIPIDHPEFMLDILSRLDVNIKENNNNHIISVNSSEENNEKFRGKTKEEVIKKYIMNIIS